MLTGYQKNVTAMLAYPSDQVKNNSAVEKISVRYAIYVLIKENFYHISQNNFQVALSHTACQCSTHQNEKSSNMFFFFSISSKARATRALKTPSC